MRIIKAIGVALTAFVIFAGCQKQLDFDSSGISVGTLKSDVTGDCLPSSVNGIYKKDSVLTSSEYIDVNVNVDSLGSYSIKTDTANGFSFTGTGTFGKFGNNLVRLYGSGKPLAAGTTTFNVKYGTSICSIDVLVLGPNTGSAIYTLGGAGSTCSGFTLGAGTYTAGTILVAANSVTTNVNVSQTGTYTAGTDTINGIYFRTSNSFTTLGVQSITLAGSGTPLAAGNFNYTLTNGNTSCTFTITVGGGGPPAVYTLGGDPSSCTGVTLAGTYQQGVALSGATAKIDVNVSTVGAYNLVTTTQNGVKFAASGTFTATGAQQVTLTGSGTPSGTGTFNYTITGASSTCTLPVTFAAPPPPAVYTLNGSPGACTPIVVTGTYTAGTALTAANTATVTVNVTTTGSYTLTTNTVNGMTFSKSGVFTVTGPSVVTLVGSGTPTAAATSTLTPQSGTSSCTFDVTVVVPTPPTDRTWEFTADGTKYSGNCAHADNTTPGELDISSVTPQDFSITFGNSAGAITTGTYSGTATTGKTVFFAANSGLLSGGSVLGVVIPLTNITATITTYDEVNHVVQGTFSGTVLNATTFSAVTLTGGKFKATLP